MFILCDYLTVFVFVGHRIRTEWYNDKMRSIFITCEVSTPPTLLSITLAKWKKENRIDQDTKNNNDKNERKFGSLRPWQTALTFASAPFDFVEQRRQKRSQFATPLSTVLKKCWIERLLQQTLKPFGPGLQVSNRKPFVRILNTLDLNEN